MRADKVFARVCRQNLDVSKNISTREIGVRGVPDAVADCCHHPSIDDVENIAEITRSVNCFPRREVPGLPPALSEQAEIRAGGPMRRECVYRAQAQCNALCRLLPDGYATSRVVALMHGTGQDRPSLH